MNDRFGKAFKTSLTVHGLVVLLLLVSPALTRCMKPKPKEKVIFVEMVAPAPPAPLPTPTPPVPEPPKPKPPEPEPPKPEPKPEPKLKRPDEIKPQTNRVVRRQDQPVIKPPPVRTPTAAELAQQFRSSLPTSPSAPATTGTPSEMGSYYGTVQRILYQAWQQPPGVAGLSAQVSIRIARDGNITQRNMVRGSGNATMDASVMSALRSVSSLPRLPASFDGAFHDVTITFESSGLSM